MNSESGKRESSFDFAARVAKKEHDLQRDKNVNKVAEADEKRDSEDKSDAAKTPPLTLKEILDPTLKHDAVAGKEFPKQLSSPYFKQSEIEINRAHIENMDRVGMYSDTVSIGVLNPTQNEELLRRLAIRRERERERQFLTGERLLKLLDHVKTEEGEAKNSTEVARKLRQPYNIVNELYNAPNFSQDMRKIIENMSLSLDAAIAIARIPRTLRTLIAEEHILGNLTQGQIGGISYRHEEGRATWKALVTSKGIHWPEGLDDEAWPIQKESGSEL